MPQWKPYQHVARLDTEDVAGILEMPVIYVTPKIDGANASVFMDEAGKLRVAKRTAVIDENQDFRGMYEFVCAHKQKYLDFFAKYPNTIIYAEFLIKHTVSWYRESAWRKLYAYDILDTASGELYETGTVMDMLKEFDIEMIVPTAKLSGPLISNEGMSQLEWYANNNNFLIDDPDKTGEGIVIKAFDRNGKAYRNRFGRIQWAKIVRQEFKEKNTVAMGLKEKALPMEHEKLFADTYITPGRVEKCKQKILADKGTGWQSNYIGELLGRVYFDAFEEELWSFIKKNKVRSLNFKLLNQYCIIKTKGILGL